MKNLILFLVAVLLIASCSSTPDDQIKGKWKMTDIKISRADGQEVPEENKARIAEFEQKLVEEGTSYEFKDEGVFERVKKGEKASGTYKAIEGENEGEILVALVFEEGGEASDVSKLTITEISDDKFVTVSEDSEIKITSTYEKQ